MVNTIEHLENTRAALNDFFAGFEPKAPREQKTRRQKYGPGTEAALIAQITEYLELNKILYVRHHPAKPFTDRYGRSRFAPVARSQRGAPDFMIFVMKRTVFVEAKSDKGVLSEDQKAWKQRAEDEGFEYIIAKNLQQVCDLWRAQNG